jgi:adenosylcobinamide-GDP ribazoletransferase
VKALAASLGFFTRIPLGRDEQSYELLRRNVWVIPFTGFLAGCLIAIPSHFLNVFFPQVVFLAIIFYVFVEGINHVDGLADFGDSLFAPKEKKFAVLKDPKTGVGGVVAILLYFLILSFSFSNLGDKLPAAIVLSQTAAKTGMLILLTTSKPLWKGMASSIMDFASKEDLILGLLICMAIFGAFANVFPEAVFMLAACLALTFLYRSWTLKTYGGINGDLVGALNCILFALGLLWWLV